MPAWSVKTRLAPSRDCRNARVYCYATTAMHGYRVHPSPPSYGTDSDKPVVLTSNTNITSFPRFPLTPAPCGISGSELLQNPIRSPRSSRGLSGPPENAPQISSRRDPSVFSNVACERPKALWRLPSSWRRKMRGRRRKLWKRWQPSRRPLRRRRRRGLPR